MNSKRVNALLNDLLLDVSPVLDLRECAVDENDCEVLALCDKALGEDEPDPAVICAALRECAAIILERQDAEDC